MTPAARSGVAMTKGVALVSGTLLMTLALALFLTRIPVHNAITPLSVPDSPILVTAVPTVRHSASLSPSPQPPLNSTSIGQPTLVRSMDVRVASDSSSGMTMPVQLISEPLVDPALPLLAVPVEVPLEIQIPALNIMAPVLGVGLTMTNAMAAPIGTRPDDSLWQTVFWYRGGAIPGDIGTATFAGHFDDESGRPAIFAFLSDLRIGDLIVIHDQRNGLDIPFIVNETRTYTHEESSDSVVLARIFGSRSISGAESQPVSDQLSRLTLITCAGEWINGEFDQHLVVYAIRASYPSSLGN
jgi:hypothetical protein